jgi:hypothetical protein
MDIRMLAYMSDRERTPLSLKPSPQPRVSP